MGVDHEYAVGQHVDDRLLVCPLPDDRVVLRRVEQRRRALRTEQPEHVLVRGVVVDGTSHMLYLSVPEGRLDESRAVLDAATRTFTVG